MTAPAGTLQPESPPLSSRHHLPAVFGQPHLPALDGVRAFALLLMMAFDLGVPGVPGFSPTVFFVLSGFLLTWWLVDEQDHTGGVNVRDFYRRRVLRIVPALYVFWVLLVALQVLRGHPVLWSHALSVPTFTTDYYHALLGDPSTPFSSLWYISIEAQFYLLWPPLFLALRRNRQAMLSRLAMLIVATWCWRILLVYGLGVDQSYLFSAFDTRWDALLVGGWVALALRSEHAGRLLRLARDAWSPVASLVLMLSIYRVYQSLEPNGAHFRDIVLRIALPPLAGLMLVQLVVQSGSRFWRWLDSPPVSYLGRVSYGACLYHGVCFATVGRLLGGRPTALLFGAGVALTVAVASVSYVMVERPFLRRKGVRAPTIA